MLEKLRKYIFEGKKFQCLEITENGEGHLVLALLKMKLIGDEIEVSDYHIFLDWENLNNALEPKHFFSLVVNTSDILQKPIEASGQNESLESKINLAFPNLNLEEFYYSLCSSKNNAIVSIGKKTVISSYLDKLGMPPTQLSIGISALESLYGVTHHPIEGSNFKVQFDNRGLNQIEMTQALPSELLEEEGLNFTNYHLLGFSSVLQYLKKTPSKDNLKTLNTDQQNTFQNKRLFDYGIRVGLGIFLTLLLANFFLFHHFFNKEKELLLNGNFNAQSKEQIIHLKKEIEKKEERLNALVKSKQSKVTYYLDELGKNLPSSIRLTELKYQPIISGIRPKKKVLFSENQIKVSGVVSNKGDFTLWSTLLEQGNWISKVEVNSFEFIDRSSANFSLTLELDETR